MTLDAPSIFLIIFLVSFALAMLSFVLGVTDLSLPGMSHGHGGNGGIDHGWFEWHGVSLFNSATVLMFLTWFGGAGYVLTGSFNVAIAAALVLATLAGLAGGGLVVVFLARVLVPGQTPYLEVEEGGLVGTIGRVSSPIAPGGTGEIVFSKNGARRAASARAVSGQAIAHDAEVVVARHEGAYVYVELFEDFLGDEPEAKPES